MTGRPNFLARSITTRITSGSETIAPSSVKATAPASSNASTGAHALPTRPTVAQALGKMETAVWAVRARRTRSGVSVGGLVFGIVTTRVKPPLAAAALPETKSSASVAPGSRKWTCTSHRPGVTTNPGRSMTVSRAAEGNFAGTGAMRPSASTKSAPISSRPFAGSNNRACGI